MKEASIWAAYEQRLQRVSAYIYDHLDEELDLDRLADIACLSPHHWHRIYRAVHGRDAGRDRQAVAAAPGGG